MYVYRIGVQESTHFSPFLFYNRHPRKAIDHELQTAMNKEESVAPGQLFTASSNDPDTLEETPGQFVAA